MLVTCHFPPYTSFVSIGSGGREGCAEADVVLATAEEAAHFGSWVVDAATVDYRAKSLVAVKLYPQATCHLPVNRVNELCPTSQLLQPYAERQVLRKSIPQFWVGTYHGPTLDICLIAMPGTIPPTLSDDDWYHLKKVMVGLYMILT